MSVIIPEVILYNLVNNIFIEVQEDWDRHQDKDKTLLARMFKGKVAGKRDYFEQAQSLFLRKDDDPNKVQVSLFFDADNLKIPKIHITMPGETTGQNSIGNGEWGHEGHIIDDDTTGIREVIYEKRFDSQYFLICSGANPLETMLLYHFLRGMMISVFDTVSLEGLENAKLSSQEIKINDQVIPNGIFMRALGLHCSYDVAVPRFFDDVKISELILNGKLKPTEDA